MTSPTYIENLETHWFKKKLIKVLILVKNFLRPAKQILTIALSCFYVRRSYFSIVENKRFVRASGPEERYIRTIFIYIIISYKNKLKFFIKKNYI